MQKALESVKSINNALGTLSISVNVSKSENMFAPKWMIGHFRERMLKRTVFLLENIVAMVKKEQEKYDEGYFYRIDSRRSCVTKQIRDMKRFMETKCDKEKVKYVKNILEEIEHYIEKGVKPRGKICIGEKVTFRIFDILSKTNLEKGDSQIAKYLRENAYFSFNPPSDIEISSLKAVLGILREFNPVFKRECC